MENKSVLSQLKDSIAKLEARMQQTEMQLQAFSAVDRVLAEFKGSLEAISRTVDALVAETGEIILEPKDVIVPGKDGQPDTTTTLTGSQQLDKLVRENMRAQIVAAMRVRRDANEQVLNQLLAAGAFVETEEIDDNTYVVANILVPQPDGTKIEDRVQINFNGFNPQVRESIKGKKKGDQTNLPDGGELTVVGVYKLAQVQPAKLTEETPADATASAPADTASV